MDSIKKGRMCYSILEKHLLQHDWDIYVPILEDTKIDCIIIKSNILLKLQIKKIQEDRGHKIMPVRKVNHNLESYKIVYYDDTNVDYLVGVDLDTEDIYFVPIEVVSQYKSAISISSISQYKNNFSLLEEPHIGNFVSGGDNIGKRLTANTEGIEQSSP